MKIGIIGCGWLGKPLATSLAKEHRVECYARKTHDDAGLNYIVHPEKEHSFWKNDIFIISISTKGGYLDTLRKIARSAQPKASIILMSSTSVYKEFDTDVDEEALIRQKTLQKEAEELMIGLRGRILILRLGGLMGDDRIAGRWNSSSRFADGPVNYIHQDDVINIVHKMITMDILEGIFNLVAPEHPLRSQVHKKNSEAFGFEQRDFEGETHRIVSSEKLIKYLDYSFVHPDPLEFWTAC